MTNNNIDEGGGFLPRGEGLERGPALGEKRLFTTQELRIDILFPCRDN